MACHNWFIPHKDTHKKAHLISWEGLTIYILIFILLQVTFSIVSFIKPGILGISSSISQQKIIELTNTERDKLGLSKVSENEALNYAAQLKAQNMFSENYWSHFAPSGKTPWDFILGSGYKFAFAGENLAKNFYNSDDVVVAWMDSPTHRDNLLNPRYKDIGVAVVDGVLNGQKTTLIVQMFGTTEMLAANPSVNISGKQVTVPKNDLQNATEIVSMLGESKQRNNLLIDPYTVSKTTGFSIIAIIFILLIIDFWVLKRRGVLRFSSRHIAHMALLSLSAGSLYISKPGAILGSVSDLMAYPYSLKQVFIGSFLKNGLTAVNVLIIGVLVYLFWALTHHKRQKSLTFPIFLEYLLTAVLVLILITGVTF